LKCQLKRKVPGFKTRDHSGGDGGNRTRVRNLLVVHWSLAPMFGFSEWTGPFKLTGSIADYQQRATFTPVNTRASPFNNYNL